MSIRGLVDSKQGHYPESVRRVRRTARASGLTVPGQCSPSFGSSMDSHCFLWWLVGFFGFLFSSFTHIANCPKGNTSEAPSSQGPQTTAVNSNGAAQASPWCSRSASMSSVLLSECRAAKATPQGWAELLSHSFPPKAEAERVPFLPKSWSPAESFCPPSQARGPQKERKEGGHSPCFQKTSFLGTPCDQAEKNLITCLSGAGESSHTSSPKAGP